MTTRNDKVKIFEIRQHKTFKKIKLSKQTQKTKIQKHICKNVSVKIYIYRWNNITFEYMILFNQQI